MIYHLYSDFEPSDPATKARHDVARMTWSTQLWTELPISDCVLARMWEEEGRRFPYVIDVFDAACSGREPEDCMIYTNSDICVLSNCALICASALQETDAFYSYRRDFNEDFTAPIPDDIVLRGTAYAGSDLYGFRVRWWRAHRKDFPDMLIGTELWDAVLRTLIETTNSGRAVNLPNTHYHRRHDSVWERAENRYRLKRQLHNLKLGSQWLRNRGINPAIHGVPMHV